VPSGISLREGPRRAGADHRATGREIRENKCGAIPDNLAPILDRLGLDRSNWVKTVREFGRIFKQAAGRASSLARAAPGCSRRWFQGKAAAQAAFV
jgi:hypothetical protein